MEILPINLSLKMIKIVKLGINTIIDAASSPCVLAVPFFVPLTKLNKPSEMVGKLGIYTIGVV